MRQGAAALDDVLITHELFRRSPHVSDIARENDAMHALVRDLADKPRHVLQLLVDVALDLCGADSAAISLRERAADGELFRWATVAGQLTGYTGATTPGESSLCGVSVAQGAPQLFAQPARHFTYLADLPIAMEEALVVPFHLNGEARGTIWIARHAGGRGFDREDARLMTVLADFIGATVHRLEVEAALQCSEERLRNVVNLAPALVTAVDDAGRVVIFNRACEALTGYVADDVIGADLIERLVPGPWRETARGRVTADASLSGVDEMPWLTRSGEERLVAWRWFRVPGLLVGVGDDVTERRRAEEFLREQMLLARAVADHVAEAVFLTDGAGAVTFTNRGADALLGWPTGALIGRRAHDVMHGPPERGACAVGAECRLRHRPRALQAQEQEDVFLRADGDTVEVRWSLTPVDRGDSTGAMIVVRDVSAQKRMERERAWYASQLVGLSTAAITIHSLSLSDALAIITEQARELIGAHHAATVLTAGHDAAGPLTTVSASEKYAAWHDSGFADLVRHGNRSLRLSAAEVQARAVRGAHGGDTAPPPMRGWLAAPLADRNGDNLGLIELADKYDGEFTAQDEAVLHQLAQIASVAIQNAQLYEQAQSARAQAEAANAAKDEFLAILAHELRNPLGVILSGVSVLDRSGLQAPEAVRVRELIRHHTRHLARLLDDLLDLARISQGKIHLRSEVIDLRAVIDIVVQAYRDRFEARSQTLSVTMPDTAVHVYGDPARLQQIAGNLLDNASKYTPRGGAVWLAMEPVNGEVLLSVRDNGLGIPPDKLESIFDLFTQLDPALARRAGGLGIGLTVVRRLTEMHGGRVHAHSDGPGTGSEFIVRLRAVDLPAAATVREPPAVCRSYRVLVVEDNDAARDMLRFVLELEGHEVEASADAVDGVEAAARLRPDVAFVDIGLPGVDGYEVARRLRSAHGQSVRLFAISGHGQPEEVRRAIDAGFEGHLTKPVEIDEVLRILGSI